MAKKLSEQAAEVQETAAAAKEATAIKPAAVRGGMFGVMKDVDEAENGSDLVNLDFKKDKTKFRLISATPLLVWKHWDAPQTAGGKMAPCLKTLPLEDIGLYVADPEAYLATREQCPWCEFEKEHGDSALGKDKGMYNKSTAWCFNVIEDVPKTNADGSITQVPTLKVAEIAQRSILSGLEKIENDPEWAEFMGDNGMCDLVLIVSKEVKNKRTSYTVAASPTSKPLSQESLDDWRKKEFNLAELKAPPTDPEKIAEWLKKCPEPEEGDKPKARG